MTILRRIARPMLSSMFVSGGINALKSADAHAQAAQPVTKKLSPAVDKVTASLPFDLSDKQLVQLNGAVQTVGGFMLATGRLPRLSSLALAASLVPTTLAGHRYWGESDPQQKASQRIHFFKNVSMLGGLLLASADTEGKPSLAWRARSQGRKARERAANLDPR